MIGEPGSDPVTQAGAVAMTAAQTTGRFIVVFADAEADHTPTLMGVPGISNVGDSRDYEDSDVDLVEITQGDAMVFSNLGMAVVSAEPGETLGLQAAEDAGDAVLSVSPELVHHVLTDVDLDYLRGYRDGVADISQRLGASTSMESEASSAAAAALFADTAQATWGLQATRTLSSPHSGRGIKVAVLDTGFDLRHADFLGRKVTATSFVTGESAQDGHGHGTHCVGTACGPKTPPSGPRYGVAYEAEIFVGKVLSNGGSGSDAGILAGISWAVAQGCAVISMSLGADVAVVHPPYTAAGRRALQRGSLIIAAAGNNADRRVGKFGFVGPPASSPHIMAVGALEHQLDLAYFSARSQFATRGGQVDVAAPGYEVHSSWPMPTRYKSISGTSMATPHVAGLAALWAQATGYRGRELWAVLAMESDRLKAASLDVGGGLMLAPQ